MTTITQLTEIVNGSLVPSNKKLDGSLVQISTNVDNKLSVAEDGLYVSVPRVDLTPYYTSAQTESVISAAIAQAQLTGGDTEVDLSGYATKAELANYQTEAQVNTLVRTFVLEEYNPELGRNLQLLLEPKVDKTELQTYQAEVTEQLYTTSQEVLARATIEDVEELGNEVNEALRAITPVQTAVESATTPKVNSIPLYTLDNNGDYVLCTPDIWLKIQGFYVPGYSGATIGK